MKYIKYFGIDLTTIKKAKIISFNRKKLLLKNQENPNNRFDQSGITVYLKDEETGENVEVSHIKIQDNYKFMDFIFGVNYVKSTNKVTPFVHITMSVSSFEEDGEMRGNNFKSLSMSEYREFVVQVKDYLYSKYGILIDISEVEFENVEIANTFFLEREYKEYSDTLKAMYMFAPEGMKKAEKGKKKKAHDLVYDDDSQYIETMKLGNGSIGLQTYYKSMQMEEKYKITLGADAMRVELKLKGGTRCSQIFNNKTIYEITDDDLKEYYLERVEKDLIKGLGEYIKKGNKLIKKYIKDEKEVNPRGWTSKTISMVFSIKYSEEKTVKGSVVMVDLANSVVKIKCD